MRRGRAPGGMTTGGGGGGGDGAGAEFARAAPGEGDDEEPDSAGGDGAGATTSKPENTTEMPGWSSDQSARRWWNRLVVNASSRGVTPFAGRSCHGPNVTLLPGSTSAGRSS